MKATVICKFKIHLSISIAGTSRSTTSSLLVSAGMVLVLAEVGNGILSMVFTGACNFFCFVIGMLSGGYNYSFLNSRDRGYTLSTLCFGDRGYILNKSRAFSRAQSFRRRQLQCRIYRCCYNQFFLGFACTLFHSSTSFFTFSLSMSATAFATSLVSRTSRNLHGGNILTRPL